MREAGAFEAAYGRLAETRLAPGAAKAVPPAEKAGGGGRGSTPRSRLLPRLALVRPRSRTRLREAGE